MSPTTADESVRDAGVSETGAGVPESGAGSPDIARATADEVRREGVVLFGGDFVPHQAVLRSMAARGGASLFEPLVATLRAADLALLNLETPAAPSRPIPTEQMQFNVHEDTVRALVEAGLDGVSIANNHGYDAGASGVGETIRTLRAAGITPVGGALPGEDPLAPVPFTLLGERLCVLAATRLFNGTTSLPGVGSPRLAAAREAEEAEREGFLTAITRAKSSGSCAALLVSLHSGIEYADQPIARDRTYFRRCADAGADVVIGHHSHTPHPVELYRPEGRARDVPIFYSLGNFVSNQGSGADSRIELDSPIAAARQVVFDPRTREGLLAVLRFERPTPGTLRLARGGWVPLWTINGSLRRRHGVPPVIRAALMPREGGGDPLLSARWTGLLNRIGARTLASIEDVPDGANAYRVSDPLVIAARAEARFGDRGAAPARAAPVHGGLHPTRDRSP